MLKDVLPLVTTLHIEKSSQLWTGTVSNHLRDVRSVSIYNLFSLSITGDIELNEDIATKSIQFIIASKFPHLESVTFWGKSSDNRLHSLNMSLTSINFIQRMRIDILFYKLSGAFDCGHLPYNLQIIGLRCPRKCTNYCVACRRVCLKFPLESILDIDLCLPFATSNAIIMSRRGGRDYLYSETRFMQLLGKGTVEDSRDNFSIIRFGHDVQDEIKSFIDSSNVDVTKLNPQDVVKAVKRRFPSNITIHLGEVTFDYLKLIGIPISDDILDPMAVRVENMDRMVKHILEETDSLQKSMEQMRLLLCKQDTPIQIVVESGVLPKLIELLRIDGDQLLQFAATHILSSVTTGKREHVEELVKLRAIPPLVHLLGSSDSKISETAAWALGNIAADCPRYRNLVLQAGAMSHLLKLLEDHQSSDNVKSVRTYVRVLANLCYFSKESSSKELDFNPVSPSMPILKKLLYHSDEEVLVSACFAWCYLSEDTITQVQAIIDALNDDGMRRLVTLLKHPNYNIQITVPIIMGHIAAGNVSQRQVIIDMNALPSMLALLSSRKLFIVMNLCWTIYEITAGTINQIQALIEVGIFPKLISILSDVTYLQNQIVSEDIDRRVITSFDKGDAVKTMHMDVALACINVINRGSVKQVKYMAEQGCIQNVLLNLLSSSRKDMLGKACMAISKISNIRKAQVQAVIDCGIIPKLIPLLEDEQVVIRRRAAGALTNITYRGGMDHIKYVVDQGCIPPLLDMLEEEDANIVINVLKTLNNVS